MVYHPLQFKTNDCQNYYQCSFYTCPNVHVYDNHKNDDFFRFDLNTFKIYPCKKSCILNDYIDNHDKKICLFFHNNKDRRRQNYALYEHVDCKYSLNCYRGDGCCFSHNKIEQLYHPSRYKSKFC